MYQYVDAALLRATARPVDPASPPAPDVTGAAERDADRWRLWIEQMWAQPDVSDAVELASPVLAGRIDRLRAGGVHPPKQVQRIGISLYRYVLRMRHRSTPFGLFAGIAPARIGLRANVEWGSQDRPVARADAAWLSDVIARLEACPDLLRRLHVVADGSCFVRDDRLVLPCRRPGHGGGRAPAEVSVRRTPAVRLVMSGAAAPVTAAVLVERLASEYPGAPYEAIDALIAELVARGMLITSLRPPMTVADALGHVVAQLAAIGIGAVSAVAPTVAALHEIHAVLEQHAVTPPEARRGLRTAVVKMMSEQAVVVDQPLAVDLLLDCALTLPETVAGEAAKAVEALARLTPFPSGPPAWRTYHARFLERYGPGAVVPLLRVIDPDTGLDLPAGYRGSSLARPVSTLTARDERLLALAQRAACDGAHEVVLTDDLIARLAPDPSNAPLPHVDLRFRLEARTRDALDHGEFTLVATGVGPAAGAAAGRFLALLDVSDRQRMAGAYAELPTLGRDAVHAQVSSPPLDVRTENVARSPAVCPVVISVAEHRADGIALDDLAVTADATRMYLVSLSTGQILEPAAMTAVDLPHFSHPLARLLSELPRSHAASFGTFTWGAAERLPFLPRVRYGQSVLSPATWQIDTGDLPGPDAKLAEWLKGVETWRKRLRVPSTIDIGRDDRLLRLQLDQRADAMVLRAELNRAGHVTAREAPDAAANGWLGGRAHEITLALASARAPASTPAFLRDRKLTPVLRNHGHLPAASSWAFAKLYGHPDRANQLLTRHLPRLWDSWDTPPEWWFVRYRDPDDHVRLRIRLPEPDAFGPVAARVGAWAADVRDRGLLNDLQWATYHPESARYGPDAPVLGGSVMAAAEAVFAADSAAALAQLMLTATGAAHPRALAAASLVDQAISVAGSAGGGMRWLIDHIAASPIPGGISGDTASRPGRAVRREAIHLAAAGELAAVGELPGGGAAVVAAWETRRTTVQAYVARLAAAGWDPLMVLPSLMHAHHLRVTGIDPAAEQACSRLARSAALTYAAQHERDLS